MPACTARTLTLRTLLALVGGLALPLAAAQASPEGPVEAVKAAVTGNPFLAAAIATGLAAIGAIAEKPELLGRSLIFVGLAEGIVIYGLIVSFIILGAQ